MMTVTHSCGGLTFQSTCPARGTTVARCRVRITCGKFQSTCPARGTTTSTRGIHADGDDISIHVPREGHDRDGRADHLRHLISIHVPREGHDAARQKKRIQHVLFQSTCPARGTTEASDGHYETQPFQSTCPARGTTAWHIVAAENLVISIHVPREGHDSISTTPRATRSHFNPRAPRGARRGDSVQCARSVHISIHVPREGHDQWLFSQLNRPPYFNPRAPRGARRNKK